METENKNELMDKVRQITPHNVYNYIQGSLRKMQDDTNFIPLKPHIKEQAMWRASKCANCLNNGECMYCGCDAPAVFYAGEKVDSLMKWGEMHSKEDWELFGQCGYFNILTEYIYYDTVERVALFSIYYIHTLEEYAIKNFGYIFINHRKYSYSAITCSAAKMNCTIVVQMTEEEYKDAVDHANKIFSKHLTNPKYDNGHVVVAKITPENYDFKTVDDNEVVHATFDVMNVLDAIDGDHKDFNIKITGIKTSCGCTTTDDTKSFIGSIIPPGKSVPVNLRLDTSKKNGLTNVHVMLSIETVDPKNNKSVRKTEQMCTITGNVTHRFF